MSTVLTGLRLDMDPWYEIYSNYTPAKIQASIEKLEEALENLNTSQNHGTVAWTRSRDGLIGQLQFAYRVLGEKTGKAPVQNHAVVDCSEIGNSSYNPAPVYGEVNP